MNGFYSPPGLSDEALARRRRLIKRAIEVFGDDDWRTAWYYVNDPSLGKDEIGQSWTPAGLAAHSQEGLDRLLAVLDELAKTVTPAWKAPRHRARKRTTWEKVI